ncbi:MAG TPA: oligoendopeptidase F [Pseudogracilibacillus sp.]|nr:oligoendopeptidase F [Pseudogracilibacillus sp.]
MSKLLNRQEVPTEQTWNVEDLFESVSSWEKELAALQEDVKTVTQYKGRLAESAHTLYDAILALDSFYGRLVRVGTYANLNISVDGANTTHQENAMKVGQAFSQINAKLAFFDSELMEIPKETFESFFKEADELQTFAKMIDDILEQKKYALSAEVEEVLATLGEVHDAPYTIFERAKATDISFDSIQDEDGNELPMSEALFEDEYETSTSRHIRQAAFESYNRTMHRYKNTFAAIYATEVTKQVTIAKLRGYDSVIDMLLARQDVTKQMYENQLNIIQKELAPHMQKFAKLKQADYNLDHMTFIDLKLSIDPDFTPETTYDKAQEMILDSLEVMGEEYVDIMKKAFNERWIDYSSNLGKRSGAFCASPHGSHPYIMMTWTDIMRSTFTLAHELGHAGHFYLANKHQHVLNTRPSMYFVEGPSTLNELLLAEHLMDKTDDKRMKRWVAAQLLGTYYHNFVTHLLEGEFQRRVYDLAERGVPLTADLLCEQKLETIRNFWGDAAEIEEDAGLTWMRQPHYYMGLYPYTYSAGLTVSTAMAKRIKEEGQTAVDDWLDVLRAGGTLKPLELIKKTGIDMENEETIREAVQYVGSLVDIVASE